MASIFTGLAFMHGHIVNRELVLRLGREDSIADRGAAARKGQQARRIDERKGSKQAPASGACATC